MFCHYPDNYIQYINRKHIERACGLLVSTDISVKEDAFSVGFGAQAYFIRQFSKKHLPPATSTPQCSPPTT